MRGAKVSRYEVKAKIGEGGMGEVYRAHDPSMGRDVAIKILPEELRNEPDRLRRFEQEVRAVGGLNHPHILAVHDVGMYEDRPYLVSELLEGSSLAERMRSGDLTVRRSLQLAVEIAEGLAAAHARNIIHRDIKPGNVFVTADGHAKVLDFGLAKLTENRGHEAEFYELETASLGTQSGAIVGTPAYMSPQQVQGLEVDHRTDVFSFGVMLYEMLSGKRPFAGGSAASLASAIIRDDPPPLALPDGRVSKVVEEVVFRCLEKNPDERFHTAHDLALALGAVGIHSGATPAAEEERPEPRLRLRLAAVVLVLLVVAAVVVGRRVLVSPSLPDELHIGVVSFEAVGNSPGLDDVAGGLTRVVADGLALIEQESPGDFWVIPLAEADDRDVETAEDYFRMFNATVAVTGRLQREGDRLLFEVEAVDPPSGRSLRRFSIEDYVSNVSSFQEEPVLRLAEVLGVASSPTARDRLASGGTVNSEGFESFLRGVGVLSVSTDEGAVDEAIGLLETAIALDTLFANGRIALGGAYLQKFGDTGQVEWVERAITQANRVIADGRFLEGGYRLLAGGHRAEGRLEEAVTALEHAVRVAPNSGDARLELASLYRELGRIDSSERMNQQAIFLRPGYWLGHDALAWLYFEQNHIEAAAVEYREVIACAPRLHWGWNHLGAMLTFLELPHEAKQAFESSIEIGPTSVALSNLGTLYFDERRYADAAEKFELALQENDTRYMIWGNLGHAYRFGLAPDKAEDCYRHAIELGEPLLEQQPNDPWINTDLASYHTMLGNHDRGLELLGVAVAGDPDDPQLMAQIAESFEDLGERDRALSWVARAFDAGVSPGQFEDKPTLRELVADYRYQKLAEARVDQP